MHLACTHTLFVFVCVLFMLSLFVGPAQHTLSHTHTQTHSKLCCPFAVYACSLIEINQMRKGGEAKAAQEQERGEEKEEGEPGGNL